MRNSKSSCIFDYDGFVYTVDFSKMLAWIIHEEDDDITAIELKRVSDREWYWRPSMKEKEGPFQLEHDDRFRSMLNARYSQYLNTTIVSSNGRLHKDTSPPKQSDIR